MTVFSLEDIEFIKILSLSDSTVLQLGMNEDMRHRLDSQIGMILRECYKENTQRTETKWIEKFEKAGITKEDGKAAVACARRLRIDIS